MLAIYYTLPITKFHCFHFSVLLKNIYHKKLLLKIYHNYCSENLYKIYDYDSRNKNNLHLPTVNIYYCSTAIISKNYNLWNRLPDNIKMYKI